MKLLPFLSVLALCAGAAFAQPVPANYNPEEIIRIPPVKINPRSPYPQHRSCSFSKALYRTKISPRNGILYTDVQFTIREGRKDGGSIVYQYYMNSAIENQFELFLTEESLYQIEIPEFMWDGTFFDADEAAMANPLFEGAQNGRHVPDGTYFIQIELLNNSGAGSRDSRSLVAADIQQYTVVVDTRPPQFELVVKTVCDSFEPPSYSFIAYSADDPYAAEQDESTACFWQFFTEGTDEPLFTQGCTPDVLEKGGFSADKKNSFMPVCFSAPGGTVVRAAAYDEVGNRNEVSIRLPDGADGGTALLNSGRLAFQNAVASAIHRQCDGAVLVYDGTVECRASDSVSADILRSYCGRYTAEARFGFGKDGTSVSRISVDPSRGTVLLKVPELVDAEGAERIFVSLADGAEPLPAADIVLREQLPAVQFYARNSSLYDSGSVISVRTEFAFAPLSPADGSLAWSVSVLQPDGGAEEIASGRGFSAGETVCASFDSARHGCSGARQLTAVLSFGNGVSERVSFPCGLDLKPREADGSACIDIPDIVFPPQREGFLSDSALSAKNARTLDEVVEIFRLYGGMISKINVIAFANPQSDVHDASALQRENETELVPLSQRRAEYVAQVLALKGIPKELLSAQGRGGLEWVAPPDDKAESWRNRRARFSIVWKDGALHHAETEDDIIHEQTEE